MMFLLVKGGGERERGGGVPTFKHTFFYKVVPLILSVAASSHNEKRCIKQCLLVTPLTERVSEKKILVLASDGSNHQTLVWF